MEYNPYYNEYSTIDGKFRYPNFAHEIIDKIDTQICEKIIFGDKYVFLWFTDNRRLYIYFTERKREILSIGLVNMNKEDIPVQYQKHITEKYHITFN